MKPNFNCSQEYLYAVARLAVVFFLEQIKDFTILKAKYTVDFIDLFLADVKKAEELGDFQQRSLGKKKARKILIIGGGKVLSNWQKLKRYIDDAWTEEFVKDYLQAAGSRYYSKAAGDSWTSMRSLISLATLFMKENAEELMAKKNMPADFPDTFQKDADACISLSTNYGKVTADKKGQTQIKVEANNDIYDRLMVILKDGQQIYAKNEELRRKFVFENLLVLSGRGGSASFKGTITIEGTSKPLADVTVTSTDGSYKTTTDANGQFAINQVAAGIYTFKFEKEGYLTITKEIEIKTATAATLDVAFQAAA